MIVYILDQLLRVVLKVVGNKTVQKMVLYGFALLFITDLTGIYTFEAFTQDFLLVIYNSLKALYDQFISWITTTFKAFVENNLTELL